MTTKPISNPGRSKLWVWIVIAFAVQIAAWTLWFSIAGKNPVEEVPLESAPSAR